MGENSNISWCTHTMNFWVGCEKVSPACDFCYAESWAKRAGQPQLWQGEYRRTTEANWRAPLRWNAAAAAAGKRAAVFCNSLSDFMDRRVPDQWRSDAYSLMRETDWLDWMILTKRPENVTPWRLPIGWADGAGWPNVMFGVTVESAQYQFRLWDLLARVGACARVFVSYEPALGPFGKITDIWRPGDLPDLALLICGGESGPNARPMRPDWARDIRDQCAELGVPFHFKQWGEFAPDDPAPDAHTAMRRVGKKAAGALLDGREHRAMPAASASARHPV